MSLLLKPLNLQMPGGNDQGAPGGGFSPIDIGAGTNISAGFGDSIGIGFDPIYSGFVPAGSNQGPDVSSGQFGLPGVISLGGDFPTSPSSGSPFLGTGSSGDSTPVTIAKGVASAVTGPVGMLFGFGILRLVLGIIGLICVAGAIYLYKPELVTTPVNAARGALIP